MRDGAQHGGLAAGQAAVEEAPEHRTAGGRPLGESAVCERVPINLDQEWPRAIEQVALGVGEVAGAAAERDADIAVGGDLDDERDLVL